MTLTLFLLTLLLQSSLTLAFPQPPASSTVDLNREPPSPQSTICGDIVTANLYNDQTWFYASDAIKCLTSLPFNSAVATRFITWYNETLQFHSPTAYLKNPTAAYQQPAVDLFGGLRDIQNKINSGFYKNQYAFEADVQYLTQQSHDAHLTLWAGAMFEFTFASPYYLATVSMDGRATPKTYLWDDLVNCTTGPKKCNYSAISKINGLSVVDYLTQFAEQNSFGFVEPNADWNNLMFTPAQEIVAGFNAFSGAATFYPGDDLLLTFENGSSYDSKWLAAYNSPGFTGPLSTGGDFYNLFVLGLYPANYQQTLAAYQNATNFNPDADDNTTTSNPSLTNWHSVSPAYPSDTITHQEYLDVYSPGVVTGYFLENISTAVLSIPSFDDYGEGIGSFSTAIVDFINNATERKAKKVIIDLQQNSGGQVSLAFDVMRLFFPQIVPFAGSRRRSFSTANILGDATTRYFQSLGQNSSDLDYLSALSSEWVATTLINADTGANFSSWSQLYGPQASNGDDFSLTERYNLSSSLYDAYALNIEFPDCYYDDSCDDTPDWKAEDIIILTDGLCTSTCSLFVEMMTQDAGVRTVVVGGRPEAGPMQAASGSRAATSYGRYYIDYDLQLAGSVNATANRTLPLNFDSGMQVTSAGFTLRDQIRDGVSTPTQFLYLPADCRIYWSLANFHDYGRLWQDAWNGIYNDTSVCVKGSTNVKGPPKVDFSRSGVAVKRSEASNTRSFADYIVDGFTAESEKNVSAMIPPKHGIFDSLTNPTPGKPLVFCTDNAGKADQSRCSDGTVCREVDFPCTQSKNCNRGRNCQPVFGKVVQHVCQPSCLTGFRSGGNCGIFSCRATGNAGTSQNGANKQNGPTSNVNVQQGFCVPNTGNGGESCDVLRNLDSLQRVASSR